jgi:hypothetical protein
MRLHILFFRAIVLLLASGSLPAWAQAVYRCANLYSDAPCAGAVVVDTSDTRTQEQKEHSDRTTRQAAALADRLVLERATAQRAPGTAGTAGHPLQAASSPRAAGARPASMKRKPPPHQRPDEEPFVATVQSGKTPPAKKAAPAPAIKTAGSKT